MHLRRIMFAKGAIIAAVLLLAGPGQANLVLSQVILDMTPDAATAQDIEIWNNGSDRSYVVAEPAEIVAAGQAGEQRISNPDPAVTGLLVTPQRMILEPGQRRLVRIAAVAPRAAQDRVYRVAIKPVAGDVSASATALKLLIGYDVLVIYRPEKMEGRVTATRGPDAITFRNAGSTNVEMFEGRQCDADGKACKDLPANRLYAGAEWRVPIDRQTPVQYRIATAGQSRVETF